MRAIRWVAALLIGAGLLVAAPAAASHHGKTIKISGHWYNAGPCVPTGLVPDPKHLGEGTITCAGSSLWTGTWNGVTDFALLAHGNIVTDNLRGSIDELFIGASAKGNGTMTFHERFVLAKGRLRIKAKIVEATGGFAGATGHVIFVGTVTPATNGFGTYHGRWHLP
jgi:hypothetical protein